MNATNDVNKTTQITLSFLSFLENKDIINKTNVAIENIVTKCICNVTARKRENK